MTGHFNKIIFTLFMDLHLMNINTGANESFKFTRRRKPRSATFTQPPVFSVELLKTVFKKIGPAVVECIFKYLCAMRVILGMHSLYPAITQLCFPASPCEIQPLLINKIAKL